ncbi:MAG: hypothetical protein V4805_18375 [Pseudomonadota bacterium]
MKLICKLCGTLLTLFIGSVIGNASADPLAIVPPVALTTQPVACTSVEQNFGPAPDDEARMAYWEGISGQYVSSLLATPQSTLTFTLAVPEDRRIFPNLTGHSVPYAMIVCYPTSQANTRADYPVDLEGERRVPHMQRNGDKPLWGDAAQRYPVLLYSHGLGGSPLSGAYLETITRFASHGYVVIAPFHGDPRFADVHLDGLDDMVNLFLRGGFDQLVEMQAIRPHSLSAALDMVLAHPDFRDHVDAARIGGFGTSLGGESMMLLAGAELTVGVIPRLHSRPIHKDPRVIAAVGYVPYFGQRLLPAFGDNQAGAAGVTMPFMAISGTADTTAPLGMTEQGVGRMAGSRYVVAIDGLPHTIRIEDLPDIYTWTLTFLDAHLKGDATARVKLARMNQVSGGAADSLLADYTAPSSAAGAAVEFYNTDLQHYFLTADTAEMAGIAAGSAGAGWRKTGYTINAGNLSGTPVCRFYGNPALNAAGIRMGPNSHFYTHSNTECEWVKNDPGWIYEGLAFSAFGAPDGACPLTQIPVMRAYNNDFAHNNSNHRYTTSREMYRSMLAAGWSGEGAVFCVAP